MAVETRLVEYQDGETLLEGYMAWDGGRQKPGPGVLVAHAWRGRSDFEEAKALDLAAMGYTGFALDMYGKGVLGNSMEQNAALMQPFLDDRARLQKRIGRALETLRQQPEVDAAQTAAMGFCFGGLCVLDLARTGVDVDGVASFHGLFSAPGNTADKRIHAKVLAMHGWNDPMVPPEAVVALAAELTAAEADWQLHAYGGTSHAFTNPEADDAAHGLLYRAEADRRSWIALANFLSELFG